MDETTTARTERVEYTWDEAADLPQPVQNELEVPGMSAGAISMITKGGIELVGEVEDRMTIACMSRTAFTILFGDFRFYRDVPIPHRHPLPAGSMWCGRLGDGRLLWAPFSDSADLLALGYSGGQFMRWVARDEAQALADAEGFVVAGAPALVDVAAVRRETAEAMRVEFVSRLGYPVTARAAAEAALKSFADGEGKSA